MSVAQINDYPHLVRDITSKGIINRDKEALSRYREQLESKRKIDELETELSELKNEFEELRNLIRQGMIHASNPNTTDTFNR